MPLRVLDGGADTVCGQMREIAEIELAIQGGTEKIEQLGACYQCISASIIADVTCSSR
jgi:hypothetical protein